VLLGAREIPATKVIRVPRVIQARRDFRERQEIPETKVTRVLRVIQALRDL